MNCQYLVFNLRCFFQSTNVQDCHAYNENSHKATAYERKGFGRQQERTTGTAATGAAEARTTEARN